MMVLLVSFRQHLLVKGFPFGTVLELEAVIGGEPRSGLALMMVLLVSFRQHLLLHSVVVFVFFDHFCDDGSQRCGQEEASFCASLDSFQSGRLALKLDQAFAFRSSAV